MAEKQQSTPFPDPPPFFKHFTEQNIERLQQLKKQATNDSDEKSNGISQDLPDDLRFLVPPRPPTDGKWKSFGIEHSLDAADPTLAESGVEQLYPDHPAVKLAPQKHLIALSRSLLATFLALCGVLAQDPTAYEAKVQDLRTMAINMHALINEYRPHQARESLILLMEDRIHALRSEITAINTSGLKVAEAVDQVNSHINNGTNQESVGQGDLDPTASHVTDGERRDVAWDMLDNLNGTAEEVVDKTVLDTT